MSSNVTPAVPSTSNSTGGPPAKKRAFPGTGENADDADTGNPSLENAVLPRAVSNASGHTMVFRKNHSFVSYGVASVQLALGSNTAQRVGTTCLMYLPVDKPYFYLSYSEYKNIVSKKLWVCV
ncbi:Capsid protein VP4,Capsid/spike protein, ssDNA virus [Cinara cedri]|uniref:Capsid protein VP4,Capsid/spike protein, ssDNA virus n=1 Tax=Cinara cedri TaxID=506608 RepID=A0A5E4MUR8_9HEMI|nr:Capsid protein VP4,Capsid/spike protein, ssDNA virus [Cinara cedri]